MHPINHLILADALLRQQELQAEAERRRVLRDDSEARLDVVGGPLAALRRAVGAVLIRAGELVRGAKQAPARPAGSVETCGAPLRLSR